MDEGWKKCTKCRRIKGFAEYYQSAGKHRSQCKKCIIKRNTKYQKLIKAWRFRFPDDETRKAYAREYYAKNKDKFAGYREKFLSNHPGYYRDYHKKRKA